MYLVMQQLRDKFFSNSYFLFIDQLRVFPYHDFDQKQSLNDLLENNLVMRIFSNIK